MSEQHRSHSTRRLGARRVKALLAGGLVLGLGAAITLAAWNDSEYATGSFATSTFGTESTINGTDWASNATSPGATLAFAATAMSPSVSHYAYLNVRTTTATTIDGKLQLTSATPNPANQDLAPVLEYRAVRTAAIDTTCDATAFSGSPTWIAGGASTYLAVTAVEDPIVDSTITKPAGATPQVRFCFDVRVKSDAANSNQGKTAEVTWLFSAISD